MATVVLSAAGAAIGGSIGGSVMGLSSVVIGRAIDATVGRVIDQRLMGQGSEAVERGRLDRFRLTGAEEGRAISAVMGAMRVSGHVIWSSRFLEEVKTIGGRARRKGQPPSPRVREYSYSVSLAIALCEGEISGVTRVWADGTEVPLSDLNMRVYCGTEGQLADPKIEAVEGAGRVPAYRGVAYVVMEDLDLGQFGNRVPQFTFEVVRAQPEGLNAGGVDLGRDIAAVALMPGTGEYALATTPVYYDYGGGSVRAANLNSASGETDFITSMAMLESGVPGCGAASLVVSWFGNDLRAGHCELRPKVEQTQFDGDGMPWIVSGIGRGSAQIIAQENGAPVYGGTPADASVIEAIEHLNASGKAVTFYPFILMEQLSGNGRPDPYSDASDQPRLPWRGRITTDRAPGQAGTTDGTAAAELEVSAFFGAAEPGDFSTAGRIVTYSGPAEWSYRRFILHYAHLCAASGGVEAFCIGSEMRGLTRIRGAGGSFPAVAELIRLAADVRGILGAQTKISYAADWSEYFGYHPQDGSGDVYFHLDPLWADPNIDFIGIDNYMPLSDWRDGTDHADAEWGSIYALDYLKANVEGGEGYDWYYHSPEAKAAQIRTPISDGAHGEAWIYRYKDLRAWWSNPHHERIGGVRQAVPTAWQPQSKPFWFTEYGCAAIDKGANEPNLFLDPKSSESRLPYASTGRRDDTMQMQYLRATIEHWNDPDNNPVSDVYGGPMIDMERAHVWAWDTRPFPNFPNDVQLWSDGPNYARGHWINGRATARALASVVAEICERSGVTRYDVSRLYGVVRGFALDEVSSGRAALQSLMIAFGFDAVERDGILRFAMRGLPGSCHVPADLMVLDGAGGGTLELTRASDAETAGRVRAQFIEAGGDYDIAAEESILPDEQSGAVAETDLPLVLTRGEGRQAAERWLSEARIARDEARFALPMSMVGIGPGDVVELESASSTALFRVDRVEQTDSRAIEAVRIDPAVYLPAPEKDEPARSRAFAAPVPVSATYLDLPLLTGDEVPHAPHVAVNAEPWPGTVALYSSALGGLLELSDILPARATIGVTETALLPAPSGRIDRGPALQVKLHAGALAAIDRLGLLQGGNLCAIGSGDGSAWEVMQFQDVQLIAPDTYLVGTRLRGQAGTEVFGAAAWPAGSTFVLIDEALRQIEMPLSARGLARRYRIGPALRPVDDPSYRETTLAFNSAGLRPYAPVHLRARDEAAGTRLTWVRRTRIDGDSWEGFDVPLGEESELYQVQVQSGGTVLRETVVETPAFF